ncbi:hypothetical protein B0H17DRAFT_1134003 [Mycena rosella]|uniref:Uncharacterized protein n=1 Tax=Mycena rosella TaxID=1033263 RepID=A0AAD7DIF0_MYCRO|nr:hypothetical protein B0H17DRAFT_1134003 [Mycena rosella]
MGHLSDSNLLLNCVEEGRSKVENCRKVFGAGCLLSGVTAVDLPSAAGMTAAALKLDGTRAESAQNDPEAERAWDAPRGGNPTRGSYEGAGHGLEVGRRSTARGSGVRNGCAPGNGGGSRIVGTCYVMRNKEPGDLPLGVLSPMASTDVCGDERTTSGEMCGIAAPLGRRTKHHTQINVLP